MVSSIPKRLGNPKEEYIIDSTSFKKYLEKGLNEYEKETGNVIVETFKESNYKSIPGVLVQNHGPFTWGTTVLEAVHNAVVLEEIAYMNFYTLSLNPNCCNIQPELLDKHYLRKHGKNCYYGQKNR